MFVPLEKRVAKLPGMRIWSEQDTSALVRWCFLSCFEQSIWFSFTAMCLVDDTVYAGSQGVMFGFDLRTGKETWTDGLSARIISREVCYLANWLCFRAEDMHRWLFYTHLIHKAQQCCMLVAMVTSPPSTRKLTRNSSLSTYPATLLSPWSCITEPSLLAIRYNLHLTYSFPSRT